MKTSKIFFVYPLFIMVTLVFVSTITHNDNFTSTRPLTDLDTAIWTAPESANVLVNPIEVDEETLEEGAMLYRKHCRSCHGRLGDGKGTGAADITSSPTDFTNPEFHKQSDGSMFWKISEGKDEMEAYKEKLSEEDIWLTVAYIKTFAQSE